MFHYIRRHQGMALVFILLVIISFVVFFSPEGSLGGGGRGGQTDFGSIEGKPIEREEFVVSYREAQLSYLFRFGTFPDSRARQFGYDVDEQARTRLLLLRKLDEFGIQVTDAAVAEWITKSNAFKEDPTGPFDQEAYERFTEQILRRQGLSAEDFHRFIRHEIGIQQLVEVVGLTGRLVTEAEARALFRQENEQAATAVVLFSATNHLQTLSVDPGAIGQFYTNRMAVYRNAERVQVNYVRFDPTNYTANAEAVLNSGTNLTDRVAAIYVERGADAFTDDDGNPQPESEAKQAIREELMESQAMIEARRAANQFAEKLLEMEPAKLENFETVAAADGLTVGVTAPFDQQSGPTDLDDILFNFIQTAFQLTPEEPFSIPLVQENAVYVIGLKQRLPSEIPTLDEIRPKVVQDWRENRAREIARQEGRAYYSSMTNQMAQGKSFDEIAEETEANLMALPTFSRTTRSLPGLDPRLNLNTLRSIAFDLEPGETSEFRVTADGGFILHLYSVTPPVELAMTSEFPDFIDELRGRRQQLAFSAWFREQMDRSQLSGPAVDDSESDPAAAVPN